MVKRVRDGSGLMLVGVLRIFLLLMARFSLNASLKAIEGHFNSDMDSLLENKNRSFTKNLFLETPNSKSSVSERVNTIMRMFHVVCE
jgi:hypothetical protein